VCEFLNTRAQTSQPSTFIQAHTFGFQTPIGETKENQSPLPPPPPGLLHRRCRGPGAGHNSLLFGGLPHAADSRDYRAAAVAISHRLPNIWIRNQSGTQPCDRGRTQKKKVASSSRTRGIGRGRRDKTCQSIDGRTWQSSRERGVPCELPFSM
jgi:hypothetical protein